MNANPESSSPVDADAPVAEGGEAPVKPVRKRRVAKPAADEAAAAAAVADGVADGVVDGVADAAVAEAAPKPKRRRAAAAPPADAPTEAPVDARVDAQAEHAADPVVAPAVVMASADPSPTGEATEASGPSAGADDAGDAIAHVGAERRLTQIMRRRPRQRGQHCLIDRHLCLLAGKDIDRIFFAHDVGGYVGQDHRHARDVEIFDIG